MCRSLQGTVPLFWQEGSRQGPARASPPPMRHRPPLQAQPGVSIDSPALSKGIWGIYLEGNNVPSPSARKSWLAGARALAAA